MLDVKSVTVIYDSVTVVSDASFMVGDGELVAVLGPSGAGKSSLLRAIAGLVTSAAGTISWMGSDVTRIPAHQRQFGLMFQDYALFPHRSVAGNIAYGLEMRGDDEEKRRTRVREVLGWVGMEGCEDRSIDTLSGGEQQRVALARALAPSPRLLMLDEPVGSLDRALRQRLTSELRDVLRTHGVTALYVTHDQGEALELADRIVVMRDGKIEQVGTPRQLWEKPSGAWVAEFMNVGTVVKGEGHTTVIRRDAVSLEGTLRAEVIRSTFQGTYCSVILRLNELEFSADLPLDDYEVGKQLSIALDSDRIIELKP